jgi:hypothetical protein
MSDLSDLQGVFPVSIRWNAEEGYLTYSTLDSETGERKLEMIELGQEATFVLDLATRERGCPWPSAPRRWSLGRQLTAPDGRAW